jgi:hypothetical protein
MPSDSHGAIFCFDQEKRSPIATSVNGLINHHRQNLSPTSPISIRIAAHRTRPIRNTIIEMST